MPDTPREARERCDADARRGALRRDIAIWIARSVPDGTAAAPAR
ncbi:hypothetical protein [Sphingomonas parva]|nr:hypothetical protein [Sphingomonas parva]